MSKTAIIEGSEIAECSDWKCPAKTKCQHFRQHPETWFFNHDPETGKCDNFIEAEQ